MDLPLTNHDIEGYYKQFKINLIASIDYHDLNQYGLNDGSYVLNLDIQHWTGLYVIDQVGVYFNPFAIIYPVEIISSDDRIQPIKSVLCGY